MAKKRRKSKRGIIRVKGGYAVSNGKGHKFSKKPQSHKRALAQLRAIEYGMHHKGK